MQLYCLRVSRLEEQGKLTHTIAALAKMNNTVKARQVIADARDLLGGNGILLDYQVMRHMTDIEAIYTYEGTEHVQSLIVGRDITGVGAFTSCSRAEMCPRMSPSSSSEKPASRTSLRKRASAMAALSRWSSFMKKCSARSR